MTATESNAVEKARKWQEREYRKFHLGVFNAVEEHLHGNVSSQLNSFNQSLIGEALYTVYVAAVESHIAGITYAVQKAKADKQKAKAKAKTAKA